MEVQKKIPSDTDTSQNERSAPDRTSEEIKQTSTDKSDQQEEDRFEADLDDKQPSGDGGPED